MLQVPQAFRNLLKDAENWHFDSCADLKWTSNSNIDPPSLKTHIILRMPAKSPAA